METILFYILRTGIALAVLYGFYKFIVSKNTLHSYNRAVILFFFLCSLLLPLFSLDVSWIFPPKAESVPFDISQFNVTEISTPVVVKPTLTIPWLKILQGTYFIGAAVTVLVFLVSLIRMFFIILKSEKRKLEKNITLCISNTEVSPFSWMSFLVITREDFVNNHQSIIEHEKAHIRYQHSWDMLLANLYIVFFWFNPFAWLLRKELQTIHEYQADEKVVSTGTDVKEYQLLLIRKCVGENKFMLANNFEYNHLQKRIKMIMKTQTKNQKRWIYSIIPFLLAALVVALSIENLHAKKPVKRTEVTETQQIIAENDTLKGKVTNVMIIKKNGEPKTSNFEIVRVGDKTIVNEKSEGKTEMLAVVDNLQGNVQGVTIKKQENGKTHIRIRANSKTDSTKLAGKPLIILDGKEIPENEMSNIKPENIENINVLKDQSATSVYGEKGKNGVIIITSKKGSSGKVIISTKELSDDDMKQNPLQLKANIVTVNTDGLYILDGREISKDDMNNIKAQDIESVSVLKDKSATAIYGEKGKNGVVVITSKSPISGKGNFQLQNSKISDEVISISGVVVDKSSKPIAGAMVMVNGTTTGTVTDSDGKFSIKFNKGRTLTIAMAGKSNATINIDTPVESLKIVLKDK